ncbi:MAG TPA: alpha/beta hydrolase [Methylibium sp.]|uniref:alpha/beta hydrolase n=1 Tax=Methylibium sp. TaxID=2067992 RepID=UPI002DB84F1A|nr:alpha/beta hydrolase [Methylibium sp.]HEU4460646.1 alpha/beta hydrolase [Methylibium sp.]
MPPLDELTPAMRGVLDRMRRAARLPMHHMPVEAARLGYELGAELLDLPRAPLARVENLAIPARDGHRLRARLYAPGVGAPLSALLYFHGGGFVIGSLESHDSLCRQFALASGAAVLAIDYRLAPEHRFPTAVNDAWDALLWLHANARTLGLRNDAIAIGGDSAGGTLAAVGALMARDAGMRLALQLLIYPGVAARQDSDSHRRHAHAGMLSSELIDWFFGHYLAPEARGEWRFAPLLAPDHAGVAPAWIGLAEIDPLVDEGVAYADALRAAGVPVDLRIWRGVVHDFIKMGRAIPEARELHAAAGAALKAAFA